MTVNSLQESLRFSDKTINDIARHDDRRIVLCWVDVMCVDSARVSGVV